MKSRWLLAEEVTKRKEASQGVVEKREWENVTRMGDIEGGHPKTMNKATNVKKQQDDECFINSDDEKYSNY